MKTIVLDGAEMLTKETAHAYLAARLALPEWYGKNLDALYDCLTERGEATLLVLYRQEVMAETLGSYAFALTDTLREAATENPKLTFTTDGENAQF